MTIIAGLPELAPETLWYFAGTVALCLIAKLIDQLGNGPLPDGAPWPGSIEASSPMIPAMIFQKIVIGLTTEPIGGIGPTTLSEPLRL